MEYALRKYSQIAIILSDVLDYDTVKHLINMLKKDEIEDSRRYNIERFNCRNFLYSQYSFLFSLRGYQDLKKIRKNRKLVYDNVSLDLLINTLTNEEMLRIYNYMLEHPNITEEQNITINKMKSYRINTNKL